MTVRMKRLTLEAFNENTSSFVPNEKQPKENKNNQKGSKTTSNFQIGLISFCVGDKPGGELWTMWLCGEHLHHKAGGSNVPGRSSGNRFWSGPSVTIRKARTS